MSKWSSSSQILEYLDKCRHNAGRGQAEWFPVLEERFPPLADKILEYACESLKPTEVMRMRSVCRRWATRTLWKVYPWWDHREKLVGKTTTIASGHVSIDQMWPVGRRPRAGIERWWITLREQLCVENAAFCLTRGPEDTEGPEGEVLKWRIALEMAIASKVLLWSDRGKVRRLEQVRYTEELFDLHLQMIEMADDEQRAEMINWTGHSLPGLVGHAFPNCSECPWHCPHRVRMVVSWMKRALALDDGGPDGLAPRGLVLARTMWNMIARSERFTLVERTEYLFAETIKGGLTTKDLNRLLDHQMLVNLYYMGPGRQSRRWLYEHVFGQMRPFIEWMRPVHSVEWPEFEWLLDDKDTVEMECWKRIVDEEPDVVREILWCCRNSVMAIAKRRHLVRALVEAIPVHQWPDLVPEKVCEFVIDQLDPGLASDQDDVYRSIVDRYSLRSVEAAESVGKRRKTSEK